MLKNATDFDYYDPQRVYTPEDLAFFGATFMRSLVAYKYSDDPAEATMLVPDMATDTGRPNDDATSWNFTLREGLTWQDGSALKCDDIKYGVSRTFATDTINGGPQFAIEYLSVPTIDGFTKDADTGEITAATVTAYAGPYVDEIPNFFSDHNGFSPVANDRSALDQAIVCDGNDITFNLNQSVPDFNYTTTIGFGAVPNPVDHPGVDTAEAYVGDAVWSDGPYHISEYAPGHNEPSEGGSLILQRNFNWKRDSDDYRGAYPDTWHVDFGLELPDIDQRIIQSSGNDGFSIDYSGLQPENLTTVFSDAHTASPQFEDRAFSGFDPYTRYYWIDTKKVPNLMIRQAMAVALDRETIRSNSGGDFFGDFADGAIKPNIGQDYAPTGLWDTLLGQAIPAGGDPNYAKTLIANSGERAPTLIWKYPPSSIADKNALTVQRSLERAGFNVKLQAIEPRTCGYSTVFVCDLYEDFGPGGWGADWTNASTVIPSLFTDDVGWNLSKVDDTSGIPDWTAQVDDAKTTLDRAAQAAKWQDLNREAAEQAWIIPTFFTLSQNIVGTSIGGAYRWAPFSSWPYALLYAKPS